jgi:hypothetical protein
MDLKDRAEITARAVCDVLHAEPSDNVRSQVTEIIEDAMLNAVLDDGEQCTKLIMDHCGANRDLAHKIAEDIRRAQTALITNLSSMR